jgi:hypothetical protein
MSTKDRDWTGDDADPARRAPAPRGWVSRSAGFDSRVPGMPAKGETGIDHLAHERGSVNPARMATDLGAAVLAPDIRRRPRSRSEPLLDNTTLWLSELPVRVRPLELARQFPRIANKLCVLWTDRMLCNQYLTDLLIDSRDGSREGFPLAVAAELAALSGWFDARAKEHS